MIFTQISKENMIQIFSWRFPHSNLTMGWRACAYRMDREFEARVVQGQGKSLKDTTNRREGSQKKE
jgi:hypothetical protein